MKYYLICGELSGDLHAGNLIKALRQKDPEAEFRGIGGQNCQNAGMHLAAHYQNIAVMGLWEVLLKINVVLRALQFVKKDIENYKPDVVIPVDFAGFNFRISKFAHLRGYKVFYYISPKIWAWNTKRVKKVQKYVTRMFCILPFEVDFYKTYGVSVDYVGNPVADAVANHTPNPQFKQQLPKPHKPYVAILPGSRANEINNMAPLLVQLKTHFANHQFVVAGIGHLPRQWYAPYNNLPGIHVVYDQTYDVITHAQVALVTSGTATLETALLGTPQVVGYRMAAITYRLARMVLKIKNVSLVNLVAGQQVVPELLQNDFVPLKIANELKKILPGTTARQQMLTHYAEVKTKTGSGGTAQRAAAKMWQYLKK